MAKVRFLTTPSHPLGANSFEFSVKDLTLPSLCKALHLAIERLASAGASRDDLIWFNRAIDHAVRGFSSRNTKQTLSFEVEK